MFILARGSRAFPFALLTLMTIAVPVFVVVTARPASVVIMAFVVAVVLPALGLSIRILSNRGQASAVRRASGAETVYPARLTRSAYRALRPRIFAAGVYYQAAMQVWVASSDNSLSVYCTTTRTGSRAVQLGSALWAARALAGQKDKRREVTLVDKDLGPVRIVMSPKDKAALLFRSTGSNI